MSVVNTMLRELADRQAAADVIALPLASATPPPRRLPRAFLIMVPVIVVAILAWRLGAQFGDDSSKNAGENPGDTTAVATAAPVASITTPALAKATSTDQSDVETISFSTSAPAASPVPAASVPESPVPDSSVASPAPAMAYAATTSVVPAASKAAPVSIGWEEVDFAALDENADSRADADTPAGSDQVATPVETATFERTPSAESGTALLARVRQQARQAIAAGNWQEANEAIRTGTAVAPDDPELALLHVESEALRDPSIAEQTATAVLNELPQAWPVRQWLGLRWLQMQQPKRAYGVLTTLAPPLSTAPDYHNVLALAAQQSGEHATAATTYRQLSTLQPALGRHQAGLAMSLEALGDPAGARAAWQQALRDPELPTTLVRYGQSRLQQLPPNPSSAQASP